MKKRNLVVLLSLFLLSSCIVKSLHPFYTKDTISYQKIFLGEWNNTGNEKGNWKVQSAKKLILEVNKKKKPSELSEKDKKKYELYKDSYLMTYTDKEKNKASFVATPFKIKGQLFLDFSTYELIDGSNSVNLLAMMHMIGSHSLVKFDILSDDSVNLIWFNEDKLKNLFDTNKIKIKHIKTGPENDILLTASSKELQKFIKKYMKSNDKKKWDSSIGFTLKRSHVKE